MKLMKLATLLSRLDIPGDDIEVRVFLDGRAPLDIDHLEIMLTEDGDVSEVWLEVTE